MCGRNAPSRHVRPRGLIRHPAIPDVVSLIPARHQDERGSFSETFRAEWFPGLTFVQDNHSHSADPGTIRGLHYQLPPADQAKLLRVARGRIRDVAVDLRDGSPTFLAHVTVELTAAGGEQVLVPSGLAPGFVTLEPNTVVLYKVTDYYSRELERGIPWNDPALAVDWGIDGEPVLSNRDRNHPPFDPAKPPFRFGGR